MSTGYYFYQHTVVMQGRVYGWTTGDLHKQHLKFHAKMSLGTLIHSFTKHSPVIRIYQITSQRRQL